MLFLGAGLGLACSPAPTPTYEYQELEPGVVRLLRTSETIMPAPGGGYVLYTDTMGVFRLTDFEASVGAMFSDSALVFLGRFDSVFYPDTNSTRIADIDLAPVPAPGYPLHSVLIRLQIDTVLHGTFPSSQRPVWLKVYGGAASCTVPFFHYLNRPFFNASSGFAAAADLHVAFEIFPSWDPYPDAHWFDGRYLVSPEFPGLKLDITRLEPDYPATGIIRRNVPVVPWKPNGKSYRPDGRVVRGTAESGGKNPQTLLR